MAIVRYLVEDVGEDPSGNPDELFQPRDAASEA